MLALPPVDEEDVLDALEAGVVLEVVVVVAADDDELVSAADEEESVAH